MKKTTQLCIYGIVFFVLAVIDAITLVMDLRAGLLDMVLQAEPASKDLAIIILYVMIGFSVWSLLVELYLGCKGISESRNPSGSRLHIFVARFIGIVNLLLFIFLGISLLDSTDLMHDLETVIICAVDATLMLSYVSIAKAVHNGEE